MDVVPRPCRRSDGKANLPFRLRRDTDEARGLLRGVEEARDVIGRYVNDHAAAGGN